MLLIGHFGAGDAQAQRVAADGEAAGAGAGFAGRVDYVSGDFKQIARLPAALVLGLGPQRRREGDAEAALRIGGGGAVGDFLAAAATTGRVNTAPETIVEQRPQLAARDAVAHRGPVGGLPGVGTGPALHRQQLAKPGPAGHRIKRHEKGRALVVFHRKLQVAVVGSQGHFTVEQARGQHEGAVEATELRGGEGQRLHSLTVHVDQPHTHRLVGHEAAFAV